MAEDQGQQQDVVDADGLDAAQDTDPIDDSEFLTADADNGITDDDDIDAAATSAAADADAADSPTGDDAAAQDKGQAATGDDDAGDADKKNLPKKVEELGYTVANVAKAVEKILAKIDSQGGQATEAQQQQLQDAKDKLDVLEELTIGDDEFEFLNHKQARLVIENQKRLAKQLADLKAERSQQAQQAQQAAETEAANRAFFAKFDADHPDKQGQGPTLWQEAVKQADTQYGHLDDKAFAGAVEVIFNQLATQPASTPAPAPPQVRPPRTKPASTQGTTPIGRGAPARTPQSQKKTLDDDVYTDDFFKTP